MTIAKSNLEKLLVFRALRVDDSRVQSGTTPRHDAELGLYRNGDDISGDLLKLEGHTGSGRLYCHMYGEGHYPVDVEQSFVWSA